MKAAILREVGRLHIEDVELDGPGPDEVRLQVLASGLCHSDYHIIVGDLAHGNVPVVLGHEACGRVEAVGANVGWLKRGDYVTTCVSAACGGCGECQTGHTHLCDDRPGNPIDRPMSTRITQGGKPIRALGNLGGFAEEMVVHHRSVIKIPESVPAEAAALLGCGVLTGVGAVMNGIQVKPGSVVVVIGCGGVGLNVVQGARLAGAMRIIAVDTNPAKLALARKFGATDVVAGGPDSVAQVLEMTAGGADYAFEVIGLPHTMRDAFAMLRKRGTAAIIGVPKDGAELAVAIAPLLYKELRIVGSMMGSSPFQQFLPKLAQFYLDGKLLLDELVSERIALDQINQGYARMAAGEVARSVILFP